MASVAARRARDDAESVEKTSVPWRVTPQERERWRIGNEDEKSFWLGLTEEEFLAQERGYRALAAQFEQRIANYGIPKDYRVLQIGCAVEDTVFYMKGAARYAIDPLADFYKENFARSNNPAVNYRRGVGEEIPFPDSSLDVAICQNLLDHVANYHVVLEEVKRVLRRPNLVFFGTDVYEQEAAEVRWERLRRGEIFDIQHPHTFTEQTLEETLTDHGFEILERYPPQPSGKGDDSRRHCLYATKR